MIVVPLVEAGAANTPLMTASPKRVVCAGIVNFISILKRKFLESFFVCEKVRRIFLVFQCPIYVRTREHEIVIFFSSFPPGVSCRWHVILTNKSLIVCHFNLSITLLLSGWPYTRQGKSAIFVRKTPRKQHL